MGGGRQALVDGRVEPVKMGTLGCTHDSVDAIWCRRFECLLAATCLQTFNEHVKIAGCLGGSVVSKPNDQRLGVSDGRFAKAEVGPDGPNVHIWTSCDEGNADNPEVSHLETDDNLPGREHGLG